MLRLGETNVYRVNAERSPCTDITVLKVDGAGVCESRIFTRSPGVSFCGSKNTVCQWLRLSAEWRLLSLQAVRSSQCPHLQAKWVCTPCIDLKHECIEMCVSSHGKYSSEVHFKCIVLYDSIISCRVRGIRRFFGFWIFWCSLKNRSKNAAFLKEFLRTPLKQGSMLTECVLHYP